MSLKGFFKQKGVRMVLGNCLGMVVLTIVLVILTHFLLGIYTHHGEEISIPDLKGKTYAVAARELESLGLKAAVRDTGFVRTLPPDVILDQSLSAGTRVKSGRLIEFTVNASSARAVALPDLADNSSLREAEAKLKILGFRLTQPKRIAGDKDWVYGLEVGGRTAMAGQRVSVDVPITLVVGDGDLMDEYNGNDSLDYVINGAEADDFNPYDILNELGIDTVGLGN